MRCLLCQTCGEGSSYDEVTCRRFSETTFHLFVAFAFTVMADPVSSVTYAIEAALGHLDGDLEGIVTTMALVVATIGSWPPPTRNSCALPRGGGGPRRWRSRSVKAGR